jgi:GT2 family glycosyltransferase
VGLAAILARRAHAAGGMTVSAPRASIVVPTRNRAAAVRALLAALDLQTADPATFEVIVVCNASLDETAADVRRRDAAYSLRVVELTEAGASVARNAGARAARASVIIFLDDDIAVVPEFVAAHLEAHEGPTSPRVVMGYLPFATDPQGDRFRIALRSWWEAMFDRMREPGHRFAYTDLLSGNGSMTRELFERVGGFDTSLRCHEDYELGYRLLEAGAELAFAPAAAGFHDDVTDFERACWRKREEGIADVYIAQKHPELRTTLPAARLRSTKQRVLRWLAFEMPWAGDSLVALFGWMLRPLDAIGAPLAWARVVYAIFGYWYSRGLADAMRTRGAMRELMRGAWADPRLDEMGMRVDLSIDLDAALAEVDRVRPRAVDIVVGAASIARITWQPGAEVLKRSHVAAQLFRFYHTAVVTALVHQHGYPWLTSPAPHTVRQQAGQSR